MMKAKAEALEEKNKDLTQRLKVAETEHREKLQSALRESETMLKN